jgi:hypothetical protein
MPAIVVDFELKRNSYEICSVLASAFAGEGMNPSTVWVA